MPISKTLSYLSSFKREAINFSNSASFTLLFLPFLFVFVKRAPKGIKSAGIRRKGK